MEHGPPIQGDDTQQFCRLAKWHHYSSSALQRIDFTDPDFDCVPSTPPKAHLSLPPLTTSRTHEALSPPIYAPFVSDVVPKQKTCSACTTPSMQASMSPQRLATVNTVMMDRSTNSIGSRTSPLSLNPQLDQPGGGAPTNVSFPAAPTQPHQKSVESIVSKDSLVDSFASCSAESFKAVTLFVSVANLHCVLTARFFCARITHFLAWGGDSCRMFILGPNEDSLNSYDNTPREDWDEAVSQMAQCVSEYLGTQQILGLAATPTAIVLGDFEHEAALAGAERALLRAWDTLPGVTDGSKQGMAFRLLRFGEAFRDHRDCETLGLSRLDETRSFVDINLSDETLRMTRAKTGVVCSMVVSYLVQVLSLLCYVHRNEPRRGTAKSTLECLSPLFFTRHGQSEYNIEDRLGGNPGLTKEGIADAEAIGQFFEAEVANNPKLFSCWEPQWRAEVGFEVWCSQLQRTAQTAAPIAKALTNGVVRKWRYLNEIHAGVCEDMTNSEVKGSFPALHDFRKQNKVTFRYPSGESYVDLMFRLKPVLLDLEASRSCVVVVAHQAVLRTMLSYFGGPNVEEAVTTECPHRTVWCCSFEKSGCARLATITLPHEDSGDIQRNKSSWVGW